MASIILFFNKKLLFSFLNIIKKYIRYDLFSSKWPKGTIQTNVNVLVAVSSHCYLFRITCKCRGGGSSFFFTTFRGSKIYIVLLSSPEERRRLTSSRHCLHELSQSKFPLLFFQATLTSILIFFSSNF